MNRLFYQVVRTFWKGDNPSHSVQYFNNYQDAEKRYYGIIAADIANAEIDYHGTYIIDSTGIVREKKVFDRRVYTDDNPEPPEPEPVVQTVTEETVTEPVTEETEEEAVEE